MKTSHVTAMMIIGFLIGVQGTPPILNGDDGNSTMEKGEIQKRIDSIFKKGDTDSPPSLHPKYSITPNKERGETASDSSPKIKEHAKTLNILPGAFEFKISRNYSSIIPDLGLGKSPSPAPQAPAPQASAPQASAPQAQATTPSAPGAY